jgi:hypothetical protein
MANPFISGFLFRLYPDLGGTDLSSVKERVYFCYLFFPLLYLHMEHSVNNTNFEFVTVLKRDFQSKKAITIRWEEKTEQRKQ